MRLLPKGAADFETMDRAEGLIRVVMPGGVSVTFASFAERGPICLVRLPQRMCMLKLSTGLSARFSRLNIRLWLS